MTPPQAGAPAGGGARLMIVEAEAPLRRLLREALRREGYRLIEATTAAEARRLVRRKALDLLLVDVELPGEQGMGLVRWLRRAGAGPIVALGARLSADEEVRTLDAGADDYLAKPFLEGELLARLRVARRHAGHRLRSQP